MKNSLLNSNNEIYLCLKKSSRRTINLAQVCYGLEKRVLRVWHWLESVGIYSKYEKVSGVSMDSIQVQKGNCIIGCNSSFCMESFPFTVSGKEKIQDLWREK